MVDLGVNRHDIDRVDACLRHQGGITRTCLGVFERVHGIGVRGGVGEGVPGFLSDSSMISDIVTHSYHIPLMVISLWVALLTRNGPLVVAKSSAHATSNAVKHINQVSAIFCTQCEHPSLDRMDSGYHDVHGGPTRTAEPWR